MLYCLLIIFYRSGCSRRRANTLSHRSRLSYKNWRKSVSSLLTHSLKQRYGHIFCLSYTHTHLKECIKSPPHISRCSYILYKSLSANTNLGLALELYAPLTQPLNLSIGLYWGPVFWIRIWDIWQCWQARQWQGVLESEDLKTIKTMIFCFVLGEEHHTELLFLILVLMCFSQEEDQALGTEVTRRGTWAQTCTGESRGGM